MSLIVFNKPYGVLSQFTADGSPNRTLAEFGFPPRVYPLGRLDADSEGLLLLSDEFALLGRERRLLHACRQCNNEFTPQIFAGAQYRDRATVKFDESLGEREP